MTVARSPVIVAAPVTEDGTRAASCLNSGGGRCCKDAPADVEPDSGFLVREPGGGLDT